MMYSYESFIQKRSFRCTAVHGVPTMFISEMDHPEFQTFDLSSLRGGIMGKLT